MFKELLVKPVDPISEAYVNTLGRINRSPDYSLDCLGLAMFKSRIDGYNGFDGVYSQYPTKENCRYDFNERVENIGERPLFCYYKYTSGEFAGDIPQGFREKKSITAFVKDKMGYDCTVLYHEVKNAVGIFVNSTDTRLYHLLLSFMSLYYPSLFEAKPLTEDDYSLIKSLSKKDSEDFYACIRKITAPYVIEFRRTQLAELMKKFHESKIKMTENEVAQQRNAVQSAERVYGEAIALLKTLIASYEGLKATENYDQAEQEMVEYLASNKEIHNLEINGGYLLFSVATFLNNYDVGAWETFSARGHIYDGNYSARMLEVFNDKNNRKILLDSIFSDDPQLRIKIAGNYKIDLNSNRLYCASDYDYEHADPIYKNYLPNPHIRLFACLGGYKQRVMNALNERNYIAAIEMCVASAGSVNLEETTQTFRPFLGWLLSSKKKVLVTNSGEEMTPEEALVWLIDKEK